MVGEGERYREGEGVEDCVWIRVSGSDWMANGVG